MTDLEKNKIQNAVLNPLSTFFQAVMIELRRRLTPEEFADLLKECGTEREGQDVGANVTPTPEDPQSR